MSASPQAAASPPPPPGSDGGAAPGGAPAAAELDALRQHLGRLVRRQRALLLGRTGAQLVAAASITLLLAGVLVSAGVQRPVALGLVIASGAVGLALALAWPLVTTWATTGDLLAQARRVEALEPALRSRLRTAVDRALLAPPSAPGVVPLPTSPALLARAVSRALPLARAVPDDRVHPARPLLHAVAGAALAVAALLLGSALLPVGPLPALAALASGEVAAARLAEGVQVVDDQALVGDITLRYVFPDYTGMEAVEVPNSDGTIHAPPGTLVQITARTAQSYDTAAIQVGDGAPRDIALRDGRDLLGELTIAGSGTWRFVLFQGGTAVYSPTYRIEAEADQPPVVATQTGAPGAPVDAPLGLSWTADDDFGLQQVVLEIEQDGVVREVELRRPLDARRHLDGQVAATPRELGLKPRDQVRMRVVARDNDLAAEPGATGKRGESAWTEVEITGPRSSGQRFARYYRELRDALVLVLADFLVEDEALPHANDAAAMVAWVEQARRRYDTVQAIMDAQWGDEEPDTLDGTLTRQVLEDAARLFRFTLTTFDPQSPRRVTMTDLETFDQLHGRQISSLESAIWILDQMLHISALGEVAQAAEGVAQQAQELARIAPDADAAELLARMDQLERLMADLARLSAQLGEGQLQEFLNARLDGAEALIDQIRQAIAEGRMDDARAMLEQLAQQLSQLAQGIQDEMAQAQAQQDQLGEQMQQAMEDLAALEQDQRQLADQLAQAREEEGGEFDEQVEAWRRLDELAEQAVAQAQGAVDATGDGRGWAVEAIRRLENNREYVGGLRSAIRARDVQAAIQRLDEAGYRLDLARSVVERESARRRLNREEAPAGLGPASEELLQEQRTLDEIKALLEQLQQSQRQTSPELQQRARELSQQQQRLQERQQQLQQQVQRIERGMPNQQGQAGEAMQRAGDAMQEADQALQEGRPTPGEGHMQEAADQLGNARQELQRQQQQMQQMQQMQQQLSGESGGQERDGDGQQLRRQAIQLPEAEEHATPEAYRKALLEGMEAEVPEEYEALKRQYYEELVRQ